MKKIIFSLLVLALVFQTANAKQYESGRDKKQQQKHEQEFDNNVYTVKDAHAKHLDHVQVTGQGIIVKLLRDDNKGIRHQKFLVRIGEPEDKITILIAYNIDIAQRIPDLKLKDTIEFSGEYIWNKKGGIVHWTHHDPRGKHKNGWLKHKNKLYQ